MSESEMSVLDELLLQLEEYRKENLKSPDSSDYAYRVCQALIAEKAGYPNRATWVLKLIEQKM